MAQKTSYKLKNKGNRTLVLLSGGIDSTAALWHVLHHPEEYGEVHVHHIHIQNLEGRWRAEEIAVKNILAYMRKNAPTPFTSSESTIRTPSFNNKFLYDVEVMGFVTGYMTSRDPKINKVIIGATATDFELGVDESVMRGKRTHNAFHPEEEDHSARVKEYPHSHLTKKEVYSTVPQELAKLTWSCRTPHYADGKPIECGRCKTCKIELRMVDRPKSAGKRSFK